MACKIGYEVFLGDRSVVFVSRKVAKKFAQREQAKIRVVQICEVTGKIKRRGKK